MISAVMGDWIVIRTIGIPFSVSLNEAAISHSNFSEITKIDLILLEPGQERYIPNFGVKDLQNSRIHGMDERPGKAVNIGTGTMRHFL